MILGLVFGCGCCRHVLLVLAIRASAVVLAMMMLLPPCGLFPIFRGRLSCLSLASDRVCLYIGLLVVVHHHVVFLLLRLCWFLFVLRCNLCY